MTTESQEYQSSQSVWNGSMEDGERVVISGMSGLFPESYNVKQLSDILYNKVNPLKLTNRWKFKHPEVASYAGAVPDLSYFDAQFFRVHYRLGNNMDPWSRKILEQAYQAIYDAGLSPEHLSGKKVGVFLGSCFSETEKAVFYVASSRAGFGITGCNKAMFANRISYWLNAKGPSMSIDVSCCSSAVALECAYLAIAHGECEAALVGGGNICLHPHSSVHYERIMMLSKDGTTKSFDQDAAGCTKSEAINVLFLQKAKDALRIYGDVVHIKSGFTSLETTETGPKYGFYRKHDDMLKFMKTFYKEANISPDVVEYVEAFGSAIPEVDKAELEAIDEVLCKNRKNKLLVGSVTSNIGYGEASSGISSVIKVLLGYHHGKLAGNLHCDTPRQDVEGIRSGRIQILQDHQEFDRTYTAVNGLSITGVNSHILLHGRYKPRDLNRYKSSIPRLVLLSGRQEISVKKIIDDLKSRPIDPEEHALLHNIHETTIKGHLGRGFVLLDTNAQNETVSLCEAMNYFDQTKRPIWFVYSGMGSQWAGMGKALMRIPIFAASIEMCRRVLEPKGVDIVHIITSDDKKMFDNILHSFVGIAAIQIALTNILRELGIFPDMIIGHSVGELGCAYADGCFTAEEMILSAYSRGLVSIQTPLVRGSMAAVGLGYREIAKLCLPEIDVACHNASDSSTISGPAELMTKFVTSLTDKGIFAKEVPCSSIAYHSRYIADAGPGLLKLLREVIKSPKPRSARWVSTSIPQDRWGEPLAKYSSAEYHTNNLLNSVLFEETSKLIPSNAMVIEVAPHGLLQAILKRSLPESCCLLPLTRRGHSDNAQFLLEAIGRLSMEGFNPKVKVLYPKVEFPVSTGTPMLSHLVEWAHAEKWDLSLYATCIRKHAAAASTIISLHDDEHVYLRGHKLRGKNLYPFAGTLVSVWDAFAMSSGLKPKTMSVCFRDVYLRTQPVLHEQRQLQLSVSINRGSGKFEVLNNNAVVAEGTIIENNDESDTNACNYSSETKVNAKDVYQLLHSRDYHYTDDFRSIYSVNETLTEAEIVWKNNWVTFIDGIMQFNALRRNHNSISKPNFIQNLVIDIDKHKTDMNFGSNDVNLVNAKVFDVYDTTKCGGVTVRSLKFIDLPSSRGEIQPFKAVKLTPLSSTGIINETLHEKVKSRGILKSVTIGDLNSLQWVKTKSTNCARDEVEVNYAGINRPYVNTQLGVNLNTYNEHNKVEMDFSGTTKGGIRVMGITQSEAITTHVKPNTELLWPIPEHWSLEDAATVPLAYSMGFYILFIEAKLQSNYNVFVHGGAGALGQAVISIALAHGCEVFTTVSTMAKKRFLRKLFPQLKDDHIGNSRDLSFRDMVLSITKRKGCEIIISCVKGDLKDYTLMLCGATGKVFDVSMIRNREDFIFRMDYLSLDRSYVIVDFSCVFKPEYLKIAKQVKLLMSEGIVRGYVRPLSRITFAPEDAARAFRLQGASRHRGRVLLDLRQLKNNVQPSLVCSPDPWQFIISDNEALALKLSEKLIDEGAQKIVFLLENPSACVNVKTRLWHNKGIQINVISDNISKESNVSNIIQAYNKDSAVESIFIVNSNTLTKVNQILDSVSSIVKKLNISLKYFALVSTGNTPNIQTSLAETQEHKITKIKMPAVKMMDSEESTRSTDVISLNCAVNLLEKSLSFKQSTVFDVQTRETSKLSLLQKLLKLAELEMDVPKYAPAELTLNDLKIDNSKLQVLQAYLCDAYEIYIKAEDIPLLSIKEINDIEKETSVHEFVESDGLGSYFSHIDDDELNSTSNMVLLPTLSTNTTKRDDEFDLSQTYLCMVTGVEGHHVCFNELCKRLKISALVLQPGTNWNFKTVQQLAQKYTDFLQKKTDFKNRFFLLGYESGVFVALEMAAILEKNGLTGTVFCIGGTPAEVMANFKYNLRDYKTKDQLQIAVLRHMYTIMAHQKSDKLDNLLNGKMDWNEKVNVCVKALHGHITHSRQYAGEIIKSAYERLTQVLDYTPMRKVLRSKVICLRPKHSAGVQAYLLHYSEQKDTLHYQLKAPLSLATQDLACAAIINRHLDMDILEEFNKRNHCDTYIVNADTFMSTEH